MDRSSAPTPAKAADSSAASSGYVSAPDSKIFHSALLGRQIATYWKSNRRAIHAASDEFATLPSVTSKISRLTSRSLASSSRRVTASFVRSRATADKLLATRLTARNANKATQ